MPNGHPQVYMKLLINMNVIFTNHFVGTRLAVSKANVWLITVGRQGDSLENGNVTK
jgi:hypothetical protein